MVLPPGAIVDPVTNQIDPTVCDPYVLPNAEDINVDALLAVLHGRVPAFLWSFLQGEESMDSTPSESAPRIEDILLSKDVLTPPGPSAQPSASAIQEKTAESTEAQPTVPTEASQDVPMHLKGDHPETSPASTEAEGEFIEVTSRKRKLKASKSKANPPKKVSASSPTPKASQPKPSPTPAASTGESTDSPMDEPAAERVPPLYIREKKVWDKVIPLLDSQGIVFTNARSTAVGIRVQCPDSANHRRLTATLRTESIGYHTYALQDERVLRAVIRGLPKEIEADLVKEDLLTQGFPVQQVHRMYHHRSKHPFDMVLVILDYNDEGKKIFDLKSVCRLSGLKVQEPKGRGRIGQCHNCQIYGHSARNCFVKPRCVKCLGDHATSDCPRKQPTEEPPSCVLCGTKGHPANYRGCPKAPKEPRRRVKPVGSKAPPPPKPQRFVPAPAPATNAWHRPLPRAGPAPVPAATPAPVRAAATGPAPAARSAAPAPASVAPPTAPHSPASFSDNWKYVSVVIDSIDLEQLNVFVQKAKHNLEQAIFEHSDLLTAIKACRKTLNG